MSDQDKLAAALAGLRDDLDEEPSLAMLPAAEVNALTAAAADAATLKRWLKRRLAGEAVAHIRGGFEFAGEWFAVDKRAYVTDPELIHLVEAVAAEIPVMAARLGRAPLIAEIGVGCGSLALALKARAPAAQFVGLDLDPDALAVAAENSRRLARPLRLVEADLFEPWPEDLPAPDLIYGDPPWGDAGTLYDTDRPASHYTAMPPASAFPLGGRTGMHAQILRAAARRGWTCELWLNGGVLPAEEFNALTPLTTRRQLVHPRPNLTIFRCSVA